MHLLDCIMGNQNSLYDINAEMSSELFQKRRTTYSSNFHGTSSFVIFCGKESKSEEHPL